MQNMRFQESENHFLNMWKSPLLLFRKRDSENQKINFHYAEYDIPRIRKPLSEYVKVAFGTVRKTRFWKSENNFPICRIWHSKNQKTTVLFDKRDSENQNMIFQCAEYDIPKIRK